MKRYWITFLIVIYFLPAKAAIVTWDGGGGDGLWATATNWSGDALPGIADDVIFNSNLTISIEGGSLYNLNSLTITNNSNVLFNYPLDTRNIRLHSISPLTPALLIDAGSTLTSDITEAAGNNSSLILFGNGGVGSIYGNLFFLGSGGGSTSSGLITFTDGTHYGVTTLYSTGVIKYSAGSGNTVADLLPTPTFIAQSGSIYEIAKNGGSLPEGIWDDNSKIIISGILTTKPVFNQNQYGNLEWNCPLQSSPLSSFFNQDLSFNDVNFISTNSANANGEMIIKTSVAAGLYTFTVRGNLTVGSNARLVTTNTNVIAGNGGTINLKGNLLNNGTITSKNITTGTINHLEFSGNSNQLITNNGIISGDGLDLIMNGVQATLQTPILWPGTTIDALQLTSGKIVTSPLFYLALKDEANYTRTVSTSTNFIEGPLKKIGDEDFTFPVGAGQIYAPVRLSGGANATTVDEFTAEYIRGIPTNRLSVQTPQIDHISFVEYWNITSGIGSATKQVGLEVHRYSFAKDLDNTFIAQYNGSQWNQLASTTTLPAFCAGSTIYECGTTTTNIPVATFTLANPFTLATDLTFDANPLPIQLISFDAIKTAATTASINWQLAVCCSKQAKFELQKSSDGNNYNLITTQAGSEINTSYTFTDTRLASGVNYYRLKSTDYDGKITYSRAVAVVNGTEGFWVTSLWPNPATNSVAINISSGISQKASFAIIDLAGNKIAVWQGQLKSGNNIITIDIKNMAAGIYQLVVYAEGGMITKTFIKN